VTYWSSAVVALCLTGCVESAVGFVPRFPFAEARDLELVHETLTLEVQRDGCVQVSALFHFVSHGPSKDRLLTFPIGPPRGGARDFVAELPGHRPRRIPAARGTAGALPMGDTVESWDIWLDGAALEAHSGKLLVRYAQAGAGDFGYVLKSGAYWRGPIGRLVLIVDDPHLRVRALSVEGQRLDTKGSRRVSLEFVGVEPADPVRLELK
jgi:hypothetical protein